MYHTDYKYEIRSLSTEFTPKLKTVLFPVKIRPFSIPIMENYVEKIFLAIYLIYYYTVSHLIQ